MRRRTQTATWTRMPLTPITQSGWEEEEEEAVEEVRE